MTNFMNMKPSIHSPKEISMTVTFHEKGRATVTGVTQNIESAAQEPREAGRGPSRPSLRDGAMRGNQAPRQGST